MISVKLNLFMLLFIAEIVSPPPSTDIKDFLTVFSEIFLAKDKVPIKNSLFSKYPAGPFHKTVFD